jgi:hypothetical protein
MTTTAMCERGKEVKEGKTDKNTHADSLSAISMELRATGSGRDGRLHGRSFRYSFATLDHLDNVSMKISALQNEPTSRNTE